MGSHLMSLASTTVFIQQPVVLYVIKSIINVCSGFQSISQIHNLQKCAWSTEVAPPVNIRTRNHNFTCNSCPPSEAWWGSGVATETRVNEQCECGSFTPSDISNPPSFEHSVQFVLIFRLLLWYCILDYCNSVYNKTLHLMSLYDLSFYSISLTLC